LDSNHFNFIETLKLKYPNQSNSFWGHIEIYYTQSVIKQNHPTIIVLVSDPKTNNLSEQLSQDFIKYSYNPVGSIFNYSDLVINPLKGDLNYFIQNKQYEKAKLILDEKLTNAFKNGNRVVLIKHLEKLPFESILILYSYGDEFFNSKFPAVLILASLEMDFILNSKQRTELINDTRTTRKMVKNYLSDLWNKNNREDDREEDREIKVMTLFSRITSILMVNNEIKLLN
jgi:hypothetical protein